MEKLMITPLPAHAELTGEKACGKLFCAQKYDNCMLENAASLFAEEGALPVTFSAEYAGEYADCFENDEGYVLNIAKDGVQIAASKPAGALYGAITLMLMEREYGESLPCGVVADKPEWRHRGAQISYAQANVDYHDGYLRHFIRAMAELKINTVYLYLEWRYQFPSIPETHNPNYISPEQARAIQAYAARWNVTVVPSLNVLGHTGDFLAMQAFHDLGEYDESKVDGRVVGSAALCTSNPRTRSLIETMLNEVMDAFDCDLIHVGGDEVEAIGVCERCREVYGDKPKAEIYIDYYCWVRDILKARGRSMGIWGDMLLDFLKKEDQAMLDYAKKLLDHTVIFDWAYDYGHDKEIELLSTLGADLILSTSVHGCSVAAPWPGQTVNQHVYFHGGLGKNIRGGLATDWIYVYGYHGAQMGPLFASAEAMMWQGVSETFACGTEPDDTFLAYAMQTYGVGQPLVDYWHKAGDGHSDILDPIFPGDMNGSIVRRIAYGDDSPLGAFFKYSFLLKGEKLPAFCAAVDRLSDLWEATETAMRKTPDVPHMRGPVVLYRYLANKIVWGNELAETYDKAAKAQYSDPEQFRALLNEASARLRSYAPVFDEPIAFLTAMRAELGQEQGSIMRVEATRKNLMLLADFIDNLADSHRPLPALENMNSWLFDRPKTNFWASRCDEWFAEEEPFTRTDRENGMTWCAARW